MESDETLVAAEIGTDETMVADTLAESTTDPWLLDEAFLRGTAVDVSQPGEPAAALNLEEEERIRRIAPLMIVLGIMTLMTLPLFGGTHWAKQLFVVSLCAGIATMGWIAWAASRSRTLRRWQLNVAWLTSFSATCANTIYFGIYSPAPIVTALAIVVFAQGKDLALARGTYLVAAVTHGLIALLDALNVAKDPGILNAETLSASEQVAGVLLVQSLLFSAYLIGRFARKASSEALARTQRAVRELARRSVMAKEARDQVRRVLNIGGAGRLSGVIVGNFRLIRVIGHGGMGEVYSAQHETLGSAAAVKVIHAHLCQKEDLRERFVREAKLSAALDSPYIVRVLDAGKTDEGPYLAMELLEGQDLADRFQEQGQLTLPALQELARQVGSGLDTAAQAGIVHRDIKPQNIFLLGSAEKEKVEELEIRCKILDFGVARAMSGQVTLTRQDAILGTPSYMAPEQVRGQAADHRADLHALVCVLFRACTGYLPFRGENSQAVLYAVAHDMPLAPSGLADLPAPLDDFFRKGFAKNPDHRFQSGRELAEALVSACDSP